MSSLIDSARHEPDSHRERGRCTRRRGVVCGRPLRTSPPGPVARASAVHPATPRRGAAMALYYAAGGCWARNFCGARRHRGRLRFFLDGRYLLNATRGSCDRECAGLFFSRCRLLLLAGNRHRWGNRHALFAPSSQPNITRRREPLGSPGSMISRCIWLRAPPPRCLGEQLNAAAHRLRRMVFDESRGAWPGAVLYQRKTRYLGAATVSRAILASLAGVRACCRAALRAYPNARCKPFTQRVHEAKHQLAPLHDPTGSLPKKFLMQDCTVAPGNLCALPMHAHADGTRADRRGAATWRQARWKRWACARQRRQRLMILKLGSARGEAAARSRTRLCMHSVEQGSASPAHRQRAFAVDRRYRCRVFSWA